MRNKSIIIGLIVGGFIFVYSFIVFLFIGDLGDATADNFQIAEIFGFLRYLIIVLAVIFLMRKMKEKADMPRGYGGYLKQALIMTAVIALIVGLMEFIYISFNPEFFDTYARIQIEQLKSSGASEETITETKQQIEAFSWMRNPLLTGLFYVFETGIIGTVVSLITVLFFRKKQAKPA